ncbi:urease accessory protein UreD [Gordonia sp. NB41Y]|uniref:urease accessory protein UreD n=1 Tax=Gordonia sp. NB41Y TaxID=875808 RepID=UPI00034BE6C9|nr:urease accessory protein UreD [Gordonia sp. NB41Y]EMP13548.2 hypothetical protein ISGA_2822 [Gordonia sp. NB41Y]WLP92176.1 urease accessory protein UreD [Gordonia sp. NB41Y]
MTRQGTLEVDVVADRRGRTRVTHLLQSYPQRVTAPLYADADPRSAYLCVQSPSGGIFADDTLRTEVTVGSGGHLLMTSQSATQVFDGDVGSGATHAQRFTVRDGGILEYVPREIIPHADARFAQDTEVAVDGTGVFVGWEMIASGRIGHGERYRYRTVSTRTTVRVDGVIATCDAIRVGAAERRPPERLIGANYLATGLIVAPRHDVTALHDEIHERLLRCSLVSGVSVLPESIGVIVRVLADTAPPLRRLLADLVATHRRVLLDMNPPPKRLLREE